MIGLCCLSLVTRFGQATREIRVRRAFLDRDGEGLLVFFVGIIVFRVAAAVYFLTHLLVAAAPVVMLASGIAIPRATAYASRRVVGQWGGTGGACCEDHIWVAGAFMGARRLVLN